MSELKLYNTLSRSIEKFQPLDGNKVNMFVCGPTVYDYIHIGNARTFVIFDVVARYLWHKGYDVTYIQNITDIDDKIIKRATEAGVSALEWAKKYTEEFKKDMVALGVTSPTYAAATAHIPEVIAQVKKLIANNNAYLIESDGWYFDLSTFADYGKLSGRTSLGADDAVSRIDDNDRKRNPGDFCVWKLSKPGEPSWPDEQLGTGRPGWHIEDTAITEHFFGPQYDIHGGGHDLMFPHHEAEIAQQESASGRKPFVKYWMHAGFLVNKESKMSKSLGNFTTLHEALEKYSPEALRYYFLSAHYRSPLSFDEQLLEDAQNRTNTLREFWLRLQAIKEKIGTAEAEHTDPGATMLEDALDNDFNTSDAFAVLSQQIESYNKENKANASPSRISQIEKFLQTANDIFGFIPMPKYELPENIKNLRDQHESHYTKKEFSEADAIRDQIISQGYKVEITQEFGTLVFPSK